MFHVKQPRALTNLARGRQCEVNAFLVQWCKFMFTGFGAKDQVSAGNWRGGASSKATTILCNGANKYKSGLGLRGKSSVNFGAPAPV